MGRAAWAGVSAVVAVAVFVGVVAYLHVMQPTYDPAHQLMSELALGVTGGAMLFAFLALAAACMALAIGFAAAGAQRVLIGIQWLTALSFAQAGIFSLENGADVHIALMALAFVGCGLSMYGLPRSCDLFASRGFRGLSWGLLAMLVVSVMLGHALIPMGIAQRLAAIALLVWIVAVGWRLLRWRQNA